MIARVAPWSVRHARPLLLIALLVVAAGEVARRRLVQEALPDLSQPQIALVATWPAHAAAEIAAALTEPLTSALEGLPGVQAVRGSSMTGLGYVDVVFDRNADLAPGRAAIAARLSALRPRLPAAARIQLGPLAASTGWVLQYALVSEAVRETPHGDGSNGITLLTLRRLQDERLRPALAALPGVAEVAALGGDAAQAIVAVKPERLRAAGLAFSDVAAGLNARLVQIPPASAADLSALEIAPAGSADGAGGRRLDQIGEVRFVSAMTEGIADVNGRFPVVGGVVVAARDADPAAVITLVRQRLQQLRPQLPAGVDLVVLYDRSELAHRVNHTLLRALAEEIAVMLVVVLAFLLHGRSALLPLATLLVVLGLTFLAMRACGLPATVMSLGGIAIALGMAVDAELVALEACHRSLESSESSLLSSASRRARLLAGAGAFTPAIVTSLVIAGLSFAPAFAFTGETGRLVRPLVLGKTLVIAAAIVVTALIAPALRDLLLRGQVVPELGNPLTRGLIRLYRPLVDFSLARPWFTLATAALAALSCLPLAGQLGGEFLTRLDEGELLYMPTTSPDVPAHLAAAELRRMDALLKQRPEVALVLGKLGRADSATDPAPCSMAETLVRLKPRAVWPLRPHPRWHTGWAPAPLAPLLRWIWPEHARLTTAELVAELDAGLRAPGWSNAWTAPVRARMDMTATGVRTPIGLRIVSAPDRAAALAQAVGAALSPIPGIRSVAAEAPGGETVLRFVPDPAAMARHQVDPEIVRATAALILAGGALGLPGQFVRDGRAVPLRLLPDRSPRPLDELLRQAEVRTRPGAGAVAIALGLLGRPQLTVAPALLRSEGGRAVSYLSVDLEPGADLPGTVVRGQKALAAARASGAITLEPGEALEWTGEHELMAAGQRRLWVVAPLVLLSLLGLLWLQFRSLTEALIVLLTVPLALVGSVWTLFLLGYPLSAPVWVGLISVVGLAMQTGVVMVVYIDEAFYQRVRAGTLRTRADIIAAHAEGTVRRLRPKLMTVITMAAALLPLLWSRGAGAEIMQRVAAPMVGGLVFSAFVTLEVIPVLYTLWRQRQLGRAQQAGLPLQQIIGTVPRWARRG